jgi:hypothetical protein
MGAPLALYLASLGCGQFFQVKRCFDFRKNDALMLL